MFLKAKKLCIVLLTFLVVCFWHLNTSYASSYQPDRKYYESRGDIIWEVPTKEKLIALTFDDGPSPTYTPEILTILNHYHAKATFFLIGEHMIKSPEIVQREVNEGHEIENHTFTHIDLERISNQKFLIDVNKADKLIRAYQKTSLRLFRPPLGHLNKPIIEALRKENYEIVLWSWHQDTEDWKRPSFKKIAQHVIKNAHSGDIVIMHDSGGNRSQTVKSLKIIIPTLEDQGYKFVTVKELLEACPKYKFLFKEKNKMSPFPEFLKTDSF